MKKRFLIGKIFLYTRKKKTNNQTAINAFKNKAKVFCLANKELWIVT